MGNKTTRLKINPISLREANEFVKIFHRHHGPCAGHKFSISVVDDNGKLRGVAICGRPLSRCLDDGKTLEINRVCTDGVYNGCSMLYGACARIAKNMGYKRIVTYTLQSENGSSLKAANFIYEGEAGGTMWTGKRSARDNGVPKEMKKRWSLYF